ncbi:tRNA pseudouridine(55) synthase TruB [Oscillatoria amoena NRMC-F 0135]|nr:tRNA pseudouridine(55) synthase TruB [Oscillatoria amoena NRMC-F 0135]
MTAQGNTEDRFLLIDKPLRWTSFDVVNKLRNILKIKKIGHAGTLDPLATGLLIICTGKMTKQIEEFMGLEKEYTGTFVMGQSTPSHDLETTISESKDISHISPDAIHHAAHLLTGTILQIPPSHSAIKIGGKRAYALARKGKDPALAPREVVVMEFDITKISLPNVNFRVICSKGTYIRSLVRDMGEALGVGAYLSQLCRTRIGNYHLADALTLDQVR